MTRLLARLSRDDGGSALTEFAIVAPVLCLLMTGAFDMAHTLYTRSVLEGIVQKTARDSGIEDSVDPAVQTQIDEKIRKQVKALANNSTITISRRFYRTFAKAATARREDFTDSTTGPFSNGTCDNNEPYIDANNNGVWDRDGGDAGQGGAKDKTVYTVNVSYPRMLPIWKFVGIGNTVNLTASTVLMNQPYTDQGSYTVTNTQRNCS